VFTGVAAGTAPRNGIPRPCPPMISSTDSSRWTDPTGSGWPTSRNTPPVKGRCIWRWSSTPGRGERSDGPSDHLKTDLVVDALDMACWRRKPEPDSGLVNHADHGTQGNTPPGRSVNASAKPASSGRWDRWETRWTTPWPSRSSASTRPNSSTDEGPGKGSRTSSWPPSPTSTGSTKGGSSNR
jgi:hypothetical protein